jgi:hypothetical protein
LTEDIIIRAGLGYIPGDYQEWKAIEGLRVPCGITIPWFADEAVWVSGRRRGEQRYWSLAVTSRAASARHWPGVPIFLTKEFDALIAVRQAQG